MLRWKQKKLLWKNICTQKAGFVVNNKFLNYYGVETSIPRLEELFENATQQITENGFWVVQTSPSKANAVIRVFSKHCHLCSDNTCYWTYGFEIFLKTFFGTFLSAHSVAINYSTYPVKIWICQDEYQILKPDFVDYFVKIF